MLSLRHLHRESLDYMHARARVNIFCAKFCPNRKKCVENMSKVLCASSRMVWPLLHVMSQKQKINIMKWRFPVLKFTTSIKNCGK